MSDQPDKPFDPRKPQPDAPTPPPAEPPTVFEGMPHPGAPAAPTPPPAAPTPPPSAPTPPPAAPTPPPSAPTPPPAYNAPPAAPTPPAYTPPAQSPPPSSVPTQSVPIQPGPSTAPPTQPAFGAPPGGAGAPPAFAPSAPAESSSGSGKGPLIAVGVVLVAALAGIAALVIGVGGDDDETNVAAATTVPVATLPGDVTTTAPEPGATDPADDQSTTLPSGMSASVAELAESTVQILLLSGDFPVCSGSGTIIDEAGTILTNAHVIEPGGGCDYDRIGIAITSDAGRPPELLYVADVYAYDPVVDLAVVRIATDLDGAAAPGPFLSVPLGDSDAVEIGDQLRILGYPGIGGDTVTFTNGVVSGFASQTGIGERSWIKTDATIAGGNSGGAAFDDAGRLVGIPTQAAASSTGEVVDCRVITDTNGDGRLDGSDQCVPIGGFLNGLRPINLAQPLIEQAATGDPISIQDEVPSTPTGPIDTDEIRIFNPGWSLGASDDAEFLPEFVLTAATGIEELCLWFDWRSLPDGAIWDGVWQVDGVVNEDFSFFAEAWAFGDTGFDYWLCAQDSTGLAAGLYEFIFYVEGDAIFAEAFEITDTPRTLHEVTFNNLTANPVCFLFVSPLGAVDTGLDELGTEEILEAGASRALVIPEGTIIADAYDCEGAAVYQQYDGQAISGPTTIDITG